METSTLLASPTILGIVILLNTITILIIAIYIIYSILTHKKIEKQQITEEKVEELLKNN
jgi:Na+-transporting methylmalonyl-CoA/oxaloacetate decarboxylase gamma subunit